MFLCRWKVTARSKQRHEAYSQGDMENSTISQEIPLQLNTSAAARRKVLASVARNTAAMLGGQIIIKIFAFVFSVYVVRRLGAEDFGRYSAAMAYALIFASLTDMGTSALSVREMARKAENIAWMVPNIMTLRAILSMVIIGGTTLSAWILGKSPDMILGIFIASCGLLLYAFQGPLDCVMIARERLDLSSAFNLLNQMVFMILGTIALLTGAGYIGLLIASLAGVLVMGLTSNYIVRRVLKLGFDRPAPQRWRSLLKASFPFGVIGIIADFTRRFDIVFMSFVLTYTAVGWYNVPYNLVLMMLLLAQSLALSMYPTMVVEFDSGRGSIQDTVQRAMRYLLLLSLPLAMGGTLLAEPIIVILYSQKYVGAIPVMQILIWGLPFMYLAELLGRTSSTMHLEKKAASMVIIYALITISLDLILIPRFGVVGAAVVMAIGQLVSVLLSVVIIGPTMLFSGNVKPLLRVVGAGALMGGVVWLMQNAHFMAVLDPKIALLVTIGAGATVYGVAALVLGAISPGEVRYVVGGIWRRLGFGARRLAGNEVR
jgi:O-antigen/teichoic acid export membrane protein